MSRLATPWLVSPAAACGWAVALLALGLLAGRWLAPAPVQAQCADSGHRYVAVTAQYQTGVSLLYVLDQQTQHLAVYEARGGAPNSREVVFVASRDISLDTLIPAFNDQSEYSYNELLKEFEQRQIPVAERPALPPLPEPED